jgi:hypothetical protein
MVVVRVAVVTGRKPQQQGLEEAVVGLMVAVAVVLLIPEMALEGLEVFVLFGLVQ